MGQGKLYYKLEVALTDLAANFKAGNDSNQGFDISNAFIGKGNIEEGPGLGT